VKGSFGKRHLSGLAASIRVTMGGRAGEAKESDRDERGKPSRNPPLPRSAVSGVIGLREWERPSQGEGPHRERFAKSPLHGLRPVRRKGLGIRADARGTRHASTPFRGPPGAVNVARTVTTGG
jgi:hypothetical protein